MTTLKYWARVCDDIICSSDVGVLKAENPRNFFGPWLARYGLRFSDALLIDDREDNCVAFEHEGGTAVRWKLGAEDVSLVQARIDEWLQGECAR